MAGDSKSVLRAPPLGTLLAYVAMVAAAVVAFLAIGALGAGLTAPPRGGGTMFGEPAAKAGGEVFLHVLLALAVVILVARALGAAFRRVHQPAVIGEVIAGILLGPSFLGRVAPATAAFVFPASITPSLGLLAQVGVVLFMFLVGLNLDVSVLRHRAHATVAISHASIITPFLLGSALALWLYPQLSTADVPFISFALFVGVSMSVTAFPVLARILTDRGIHRTPMGIVALACAAVDDVTAWCLLALVVSVAQAGAGRVLPTVVMTLFYIATMFLIVRPLAHRVVRRQQRFTQGTLAWIFVALLTSALMTEGIGIHAVFGAFFLGAVIPHDTLIAREVARKLDDVVIVLLLPAFFAFTGLRTQIDLVSGWQHWLICTAIIVVACLGKFGGSTLAARLAGLDWRDAASLGVLLNTRGLMELVVLNIGLDLQVITPTFFAMMVLMALTTTLATTPILQILMPSQRAPDAQLRATAPAR